MYAIETKELTFTMLTSLSVTVVCSFHAQCLFYHQCFYTLLASGSFCDIPTHVPISWTLSWWMAGTVVLAYLFGWWCFPCFFLVYFYLHLALLSITFLHQSLGLFLNCPVLHLCPLGLHTPCPCQYLLTCY